MILDVKLKSIETTDHS